MIGSLLASACSNQPLLRDDYVGKRWLQPGNIQKPQPRDNNGNPVFEPRNQQQEEPPSTA